MKQTQNEKCGVLFFSSDDWDSGLKTSKYHMARLLAADGHTVVYVNSIGLRRQSFRSGFLRKAISRLRTIFKGVRRVENNIYVVTPFIVPFHSSVWVNRLNRWLLVLTVRMVKRRLGLQRPELWLFLPNHADLVGEFNERLSLYYVVDEHSLFHGVDSRAMKNLEDRLVQSADIVIGTAHSLCESRRPLARNLLYLPHGVDVAHFRQALASNVEVPADIAALPRPIIGFFGLIEEWIDLEIIAAAARRHPQWSVVLLGKIAVDVSSFRAIGNLHFLGPRSFASLPAYCKGFDCAILPFRVTDMTVHVNPLKMREYLAAGLPVVSTDLPEVRRYSPPVRIAHNADEFSQQLEAVLGSDAARDRQGISRLMDSENWEGRYAVLRAELERLVSGNTSSDNGVEQSTRG